MPPLSTPLSNAKEDRTDFWILPWSNPAFRQKVRFPNHHGKWIEAILDEAGLWDCPELPVLNRVLNALYPPRKRPFGRQEAVDRVASWLKGEVFC